MMAGALLSGLLPFLFLMGGFQPPVPQDPDVVMAVHATLASEIRPGGSFYCVSYTQGQLEASLGMLLALAEADEDLAPVAQVPDFLRELGLFAIQGIAAANHPRPDGQQDSLVFYAVDPAAQRMPGWTAGFGREPQGTGLLEYLPSDTALALSLNADAAEIWSIVQSAIRRFGNDADEDSASAILEELEQWTLSPRRLSQSWTGRLVLGLQLNPEAPMPIPLGQEMAMFPSPGLVAVLEVNDDALTETLLPLLRSAGLFVPETREIAGVPTEVFTLAMPGFPMPLALCFARHEKHLVVTTTAGLMAQALSARASQTGLPASIDFQRIIGTAANAHHGLAFVDASFARALNHVIASVIRMGAQEEPGMEFLEAVLQPRPEVVAGGVIERTPNGFRIRSVGSGMLARHAVSESPWTSSATIGMLAAIAIPSFMMARETAQDAQCRNNLRRIENAKDMWAIEHHAAPEAQPTIEDLQPYLQTMPECPRGGTYTVHPMGTPPSCSVQH